MLLLAVAALGLLGVFVLVANYVSDVNTQVGPKVTVLELTREAPKNQAITDNMVVAKRIPKTLRARRRADRHQAGGGLVPSSDLARNSILQEGMLVTPPQLRDGEREVAILVDASTGVAGKIQAGPRRHHRRLPGQRAERSSRTARSSSCPARACSTSARRA